MTRPILIALIALATADSGMTMSPRPIPHPHLTVFGNMVTTEGPAVASMDVWMERSPLPLIVANAEYMTVGPRGPWIPDTTTRPGFHVENPTFHRLRVTGGSSERVIWLLIDDIVTGRADSRRVNASYMFSPFGQPTSDLWDALQKAPRIRGSSPAGPPISWINPTSFAWIMPSDTLVFEQKANSHFKVTLRARVR